MVTLRFPRLAAGVADRLSAKRDMHAGVSPKTIFMQSITIFHGIMVDMKTGNPEQTGYAKRKSSGNYLHLFYKLPITWCENSPFLTLGGCHRGSPSPIPVSA
jgi:hypothetical protein